MTPAPNHRGGGGRHAGQAHHQGRPAEPQAVRPAAYRDGDGKLRPALFDDEAHAEAQRWAEVKSSQLRRFYGAVVAFVRKCDIDRGRLGDTDAKVSMALLKASATYAAARDPKHRPIAEFFGHHAGHVGTIEAYRDFSKHFEAVVAYHKHFERGRGRGDD